jgi:hypothetical protein
MFTLPRLHFHASLLTRLRDIKSYQDAITTFGIPALQERFEFIRQLGQIFLIQPEVLKSFITSNYLGRIEPSLLKPYIALRSDWGQFEKGFNDVDPTALGGSDPAAGNAAGGVGLKDRFGRLSVMMKELEGLRPMEGISMPGMSMPSIPSGFAAGFSMPSMPSMAGRGFGGGSAQNGS